MSDYIKEPFSTPRWHWTMPWIHHRYAAVRFLGRVARRLLTWEVRIPRGFSLSSRFSYQANLTEKAFSVQEARWQASEAVEQHERAWANLLNGCPDNSVIRLHFYEAGHFRFFILSTTTDGQPHVYARRTATITAEQRTVKHDLLVIEKRRGVTGTDAAQLMESSVNLYRKMGVTGVMLVAGLSSGAAAWSKFGFRPASVADWQKVKRVVRRNFRKLETAYPEFIAAYEARTGWPLKETVDEILDQDEPDSIWDLHSIQQGEEAKLLGEVGGLGGRLLQNSRWTGILDLTDQNAVDVFERYMLKRAAHRAARI
jgi:hypothetical protein